MVTQMEMDGTVNGAPAGHGGCQSHRLKHVTVHGRWSEHMQDLTDWCMMMNKSQNNTTHSPPASLDEQLNTPDSSVHGEFNFGLYDSGGNLVGLPKANKTCDLWGTPSPLHMHSELWNSPGDIWLPPTNAFTTPTMRDNNETVSPDFLKKHDATKSNGDVLLSQKPMLFKLQTNAKTKQTKNRLVSLFKSEEPKTSNFKLHSDSESKQSRNGLTYKYFNLVPAVAIKVEEPDFIPIEGLDPLKKLTDDSKCFGSTMKVPEYITPDSVKYEIDDFPPCGLENGTDSVTSSHHELSVEQPDLSPQLELEGIANQQTAAPTTTDDLGLIVDRVGGFDLLSFVFNNNTQDFNSSLLLPDDSVLLPSISKSVQRNLCESSLIQTCSKNLQQPSSGKDQYYFAREDDDLRPVMSEVERPSKEKVQQRRQTMKRRYSSVSYGDSSFDALNGTSDDDDMLDDASTSMKFEAGGKNDANRKASKKRSAGRRKKKKKSVDLESDPELVGPERYRELRDRNNEASRKSRLNRKSREIEIKQQAFELERDNRKLKAKANEMEQLVIRLRKALMKMVLKKK